MEWTGGEWTGVIFCSFLDSRGMDWIGRFLMGWNGGEWSGVIFLRRQVMFNFLFGLCAT